jgi:L-fucose mutarotase
MSDSDIRSGAESAGGVEWRGRRTMLIGLDPLLTPDLLHALAAMGPGDTIALVDANYPATRGRRLVTLAGCGTPQALAAVLTLLPIDDFVPDPCRVMQVVGEPARVPEAVGEMNALLAARGVAPAVAIERHAFYAAAEAAYAIVLTGERRGYANILLTKGVVTPPA